MRSLSPWLHAAVRRPRNWLRAALIVLAFAAWRFVTVAPMDFGESAWRTDVGLLRDWPLPFVGPYGGRILIAPVGWAVVDSAYDPLTARVDSLLRRLVPPDGDTIVSEMNRVGATHRLRDRSSAIPNLTDIAAWRARAGFIIEPSFALASDTLWVRLVGRIPPAMPGGVSPDTLRPSWGTVIAQRDEGGHGEFERDHPFEHMLLNHIVPPPSRLTRVAWQHDFRVIGWDARDEDVDRVAAALRVRIGWILQRMRECGAESGVEIRFRPSTCWRAPNEATLRNGQLHAWVDVPAELVAEGFVRRALADSGGR